MQGNMQDTFCAREAVYGIWLAFIWRWTFNQPHIGPLNEALQEEQVRIVCK